MKPPVVSNHGGRAEVIADTERRTVTVYHVTAHDSLPEGQGYQYKTTFDVSQCSEAEILCSAANSWIIAARGKLGFRATDPEKLVDLTIDAAKLLKSGRKGSVEKRKAKALKALVALGISEEEAKAKLEELQ